jgi:hypothetical protein
MVAMFERGIEPADRDARQAALAIAALCVGGMVLARTIEDADLAAEVREAARALALDVAGFNGTAAAAWVTTRRSRSCRRARRTRGAAMQPIA